jgi:hypothetical protein
MHKFYRITRVTTTGYCRGIPNVVERELSDSELTELLAHAKEQQQLFSNGAASYLITEVQEIVQTCLYNLSYVTAMEIIKTPPRLQKECSLLDK